MTLGSGQAHGVVSLAVRSGKLPPITPETKCVDCGARATGYDHRDYNKPLHVEPVCQKCNIRRGPALPYIGNKRKTHKLCFLMPKPVLKELRALKKKTDMPMAQHIRRAVEAYLKSLSEGTK